MEFHFENTAEKYFANTLKRLDGEKPVKCAEGARWSFADLKIMEYWVRFMRAYPDGHCREFCDNYATSRFFEEYADSVYEIRQQVKFPKGITASIDDKSYSVQELLEEFHDNRNVRLAKQFFEVTAYLDRENDCIRPILVQVIADCATNWIKKGCAADDVSLQRIFELKKIFHLSDEAVELELYLWLRNHQRLLMRLETIRAKDGVDFDPNERGAFKRVALLTGLEPTIIHELCAKEGTLVKFHLIQMEETFRNADLRIKRKELYLAEDVSDYLYGFSDVSHIMNFKPANPPLVAFDQIASQNSRAEFVLQLLQSHMKGTPLNILFYGREGTGKTELAKALAQKMNVEMLSVGIGEESMNEETLLHHRLRSLLLAEWECEKNGGFILMDEADLVLNKGEKGLLNILFENLKVPVIWITNDIKSIENSTRRRFNYALEFSTFGKRERIAIWSSVLKTQNAESMMDASEIDKIATEIPVMAGSAMLAVRAAKQIASNANGGASELQQIIREVANAHAKLLGIETENNKLCNTEPFHEEYICFSDKIDKPLRYAIPLLQNFDAKLRQCKACGSHENLNMLLYGPPGTGKTAFANFIAHDIMHRDIVVKRASDILGSYVGETERNIRDLFKEVEKNEAVLFIDEADSFLESRNDAQHRWEISQVNEFICQMDQFNGLFIAATNFERSLDKAIRRRFHFKMGFEYMERAQIKKVWGDFFGGSCPETILEQDNVSISDFAAVRQKLRYMPDNLKTNALVTELMLDEIANKDDHYGRRLGL